MPGTPVIKPELKEPFINYAHRRAVELASQSADPILNPQAFHMIYWTVMGGFGFAPYYGAKAFLTNGER